MIAPAVLLALVLAAPDAGTPAPKPPAVRTPNPVVPTSPEALKQRIEIDADKLEIQSKGNVLQWTGNVRARRGTTKLACERLVAHYTADQHISRIECVGNVDIVDGDRWAKGDRAEFDNLKGVLVVTGSPEARQGRNHMRGTKVTFHMEKDVVEVENPKVTVSGDAVPVRPPGGEPGR